MYKCTTCSCNHKLLQNLCQFLVKRTRSTKQVVITVAVVTVCRSYKVWSIHEPIIWISEGFTQAYS